MLPVRSAKLTPGTVARRVIEAPGLRPFMVIGDDKASGTGCSAMRAPCTSAARSAWWSMSRPHKPWRGCAHWRPACHWHPWRAMTWLSVWA
ncbi:hypothetical protein SSTU70S_03726 [Stutzerimonas stutzeri]